eukprot:SAG31_NODE_2613_length_5377_cov_16.760894_3_plen_93_part_00
MAHSKSSPMMVLRFSRWHLSLAVVVVAWRGARSLSERIRRGFGEACAKGQRGRLRHWNAVARRDAGLGRAGVSHDRTFARDEADELGDALLH